MEGGFNGGLKGLVIGYVFRGGGGWWIVVYGLGVEEGA